MEKFGILIVILIVAIVVFVFIFARKETANAPIMENNHQNLSISNMLITSPSFNNNDTIPQKFTCDDANINPEIHIQNVPENAESLALIMDDPDAPSGTFTHWTVWNINPKTTVINEKSVPPGSIEGKTSFGRVGYGGPCPPKGKPHRYFFKIYALDAVLELPHGATRSQLETEINKHLLAQAELVGLYGR